MARDWLARALGRLAKRAIRHLADLAARFAQVAARTCIPAAPERSEPYEGSPERPATRYRMCSISCGMATQLCIRSS
jgi:hypothetical protein